MKHYKFLTASLLLAIGGGSAVAQTDVTQHFLAKGGNANPVAYLQEVNEAGTPAYPKAGTYYIKNVATGKFMAAGSFWGSHAIVDDHGFDVKLATLEEGKYTIDTQISNGGAKNFLNGEFTDGASFTWTFVATTAADGTPAFYITNGTKNLVAQDGNQDVVLQTTDNDYAKWVFISEADRIADLANATTEAGKDATWLIKGHNFGRNDTRNNAWQGGLKLGGDYTNMNTEKYNTDFDVNQTIKVPNGQYVLEVQGFYRNGAIDASAAAHLGGSEKLNAIAYANTKEASLLSIYADAGKVDAGASKEGIKGKFPDSQENARKFFSAGAYNLKLAPVTVVDGILKIGVKKVEKVGADWACFDNFRLTYYGEVNDVAVYKEAYEEARTAAKAAVSDKTYAEVVGAELTALNTAINANVAEETKDAYVTAIKALNEATRTFKEAAPKYQTLVKAKTLEQTKLPYALDEKYTIFTTSKEVTPVDAADAVAKANAIISARRAYVESNGMAEGVVGAEDYTSKVTNPNFTDGINGWNQSQDKNGSAKDGETWTNVNGTKGGKYYDYWNGSANNQRVSQEVANLTPGKYIVTVKARATQGFWMYLRINDNDKNATDINEIGNTGGVFDRGWNDYTAEFTVGENGKVKIEVGNYKPDGVKNKDGWFGFGDVRLVRLSEAVTLDETADNAVEAKEAADVTLKRTFVANKWNTLVLPFAVSDADVKTTFGADAKIVKYSNADDANINFTTSTKGIEANVPVLIMPVAVNAKNTYTFNGVSIVEAAPKADGTNYSFVGSYKPYDLVNDDYMLYADKWWKTETGDSYKIKAFRAYIKANTPAAAKQLNLVIDGQTTGLKLNTVNGNIEGETYNIAGQRVANSYKGLIIKNGKKIIKK